MPLKQIFCLCLVLHALLATANFGAVEDPIRLRFKAENGNPKAQLALGLRYLFGHGVPKDTTEAAKWYRKAAEQGEVLAQYNLGLWYAKGEGVPQDSVEAVKWYRKAAQQGDAYAQFNLGFSYFKGEGIPRDTVEGLAWINVAATTGEPRVVKHRETLERRVGPEEIMAAQKRGEKILKGIEDEMEKRIVFKTKAKVSPKAP